jgi:hypothetical protein
MARPVPLRLLGAPHVIAAVPIATVLAHNRSPRPASGLSHFVQRAAAHSPQNIPANNTAAPLMRSYRQLIGDYLLRIFVVAAPVARAPMMPHPDAVEQIFD